MAPGYGAVPRFPAGFLPIASPFSAAANTFLGAEAALGRLLASPQFPAFALEPDS